MIQDTSFIPSALSFENDLKESVKAYHVSFLPFTCSFFLNSRQQCWQESSGTLKSWEHMTRLSSGINLFLLTAYSLSSGIKLFFTVYSLSCGIKLFFTVYSLST